MGLQTPLYQEHQHAQAKIVDFSGWDMPLHYGSQIDEHHKVRQDAGVFDVSHMLVVDISGRDAKAYLRKVLANDVAKLQQTGKALYGCMLNEQGGVIDDLITYYLDDEHYRIVVNAGTRDKDLAWFKQCSTNFDVQIKSRPELMMLAIQGPNARTKVLTLLSDAQKTASESLDVFQGVAAGEWFIARTGYTGEDGFEIMLPKADGINLWKKLLEIGVAPCGLGARDTLRLEAGLNLYGSDMTDETSPLESNLAWTVAMQPTDRQFIGRQALETQKQQGLKNKLVGLVLEDRGVLRNHQQVIVEGIGAGEITSGSYSPTLGLSIALARVPLATGTHCQVDIRGKLLRAKVVKPPFVKHGQNLIK